MAITNQVFFGNKITTIYSEHITGKLPIVTFEYLNSSHELITMSQNVEFGGVPTFPTDVEDVPAFGVYPALTFQGWDRFTVELTNIQQDVYVHATYATVDDYFYFIINVTSATTGTIPLYLNKASGDTITIDRGDGTIQTNSTTSTNVIFNHTYTLLNRLYAIKIKVTNTASGAISTNRLAMGHGSSTTTVIGGQLTVAKQSLLRVYTNIYGLSLLGYAFSGCTSLSLITTPNISTSFSDYAFSECQSLTSIATPSTSTVNIGTAAFSNCYKLTNFVIPTTRQIIYNSCFSNCYSLRTLTNYNTPFSTSFLNNCRSITSIKFPNNITTIGDSALYTCTGLTNIIIPSNITTIYNNAFSNCYNILDYIFERTIPPTFSGSTIFNGINASTIFWVPDESVDLYKTTTNLTQYANRIFGISQKWR